MIRLKLGLWIDPIGSSPFGPVAGGCFVSELQERAYTGSLERDLSLHELIKLMIVGQS
jgi:hypothetical protein